MLLIGAGRVVAQTLHLPVVSAHHMRSVVRLLNTV